MLERIIDQVLNRVDIVDVVSSYIPLKRVGANFRALCPFHSERTPSFYVSPAKQIFHCFGCGVGGNAIHFVMRIENLTFIEALKLLAQRAKVDIDFNSSSNPKERAVIKQKDELINIHQDCFAYFKEELFNKKNIEAAKYVIKRRINKDTAKKFGLGYCPFKNDLYNMLLKKYSKEILELSGIFIKRNGKNYCRFEGRLIFPIFDTMGRVIAFGGRAISDSISPKYMNSSDTLIFSKSKMLYGLNFAKNSKENDFLVVEGYMDVLMLHQEGIDNAVGVLGTALTQEHSYILRRYKNDIILCLDADEAGRKAALRGADILYQNGLMVRIMELENAKDPDEYVKRFGKDAFLLKKQNALFFIDYKIKELLKGFDLNQSEQKFKFVREYFEKILTPLNNEVERTEYIKKLADLTKIKEELITREYSNVLQKEQKRIKDIDIFRQAQQKSNLSEEERLRKSEIYLLSLYAEWAPKSDQVKDFVKAEDFFSEDSKNLFITIKNLIDEGIELNYSMLLSFFTDEKVLSELTNFSSRGFEMVDKAIKAIDELKTNIKTMVYEIELKEAEKNNDNEKMLEILSKLKELKSGREG